MQKKLLVVEDSRAFRNYLRQQLSVIGYDVVCTETLAQTQQLLAHEQNIFCAVLDHCLPDAQDGQAINYVLQQGIRVVVLTGTFDEKTREHFIKKGVLDYILKESMGSISYLFPMMKRLLNNLNHKALVVDDSHTMRRYISELLQHQYIETLCAENGSDAQNKLRENPEISIIITDHDMPLQDGISMIRDIREQYGKDQLAILGISGSNEKTITARFLKAGANDFLYKPFNQEEFYCRVHHLLDMKETTNCLFQLANQDALTGLWNRRYFFSQDFVQLAPYHIAMLDIDFFKKINDTYGHDAGDKVLIEVAKTLNASMPQALIARFGGEEFCIQSTEEYDAFIVAMEKLRSCIERLGIAYNDETLHITISIGCSRYNDANIDTQIQQADMRLYEAKESGRNRLVAD